MPEPLANAAFIAQVPRLTPTLASRATRLHAPNLVSHERKCLFSASSPLSGSFKTIGWQLFPRNRLRTVLPRSSKFRLAKGITTALEFGGLAMFTKAGQTFWGRE
jgi:hypothetical protein